MTDCLDCGHCPSCIDRTIAAAEEHTRRTYFEQTPRVWSKRDDANLIRVTFSDVTLALTTVEASWLAANLQKEIREVERAELGKALPLTVEQKRALRVGDRVVVRMDDGTDQAWAVRCEPWQLGHGIWVVGLDGISGGYALGRVTGIISTAHSRGPTA